VEFGGIHRGIFLRNGRRNPRKAKMAEKKDAKSKASPCDRTEKNKEKSSGDPEKELKGNLGEQGRPKKRNSPRRGREEADNHAKGARDRGHGRSGPGLARDTGRADNNAQEGVYTHTSRADSNRSNDSPRTGEWSCATVQDKRRKRIHADPVPDMDPDPDPDLGPRRHLTDTQGDGNEGLVIALRGLQASLTAMSGGSAKNGGFPQFDGTSLGYLRFRWRWSTFQELHYASTQESDLVDILHDRCMKKGNSRQDKMRRNHGGLLVDIGQALPPTHEGCGLRNT
jgi:hypothetical protein